MRQGPRGSAASTEVSAEEGQRALARQLGRLRIERAALVAVEAVVGVVEVHLDFRMRLLERLDALDRNVLVLVAKMREPRPFGLARDLARRGAATAVVRR